MLRVGRILLGLLVAVAITFIITNKLVKAKERTRYTETLEKTVDQRTGELRESEEKYRDLVENATDGIYTIDTEGNFISINRALVEMLGYTYEEMIKENLADYLDPEIKDSVWADFQKKVRHGLLIKDYSITAVHRTGQRVFLEVNASPIYKDGKIWAVRNICRDITERKNLEQQLIQKERLAAIGEMSAGVAHEIKNPLNSIKLMGELLRKKLAENKSVKKNLTTLLSGVKELTTLLEDFLLFARPSAIRTKRADMNVLIQDVVSFMSVEVEQRSVRIDLDLSPDLPQVNVDVERFKWQVVVNLVKNAVEAMPEGGTLTIKTGTQKVNELPRLIINVSDTGHGIPPEIGDRIFDPFFSTRQKGTGLGLAIVYKTIQVHEGTISVRSQEGEGTTFTILLPIEHEMG